MHVWWSAAWLLPGAWIFLFFVSAALLSWFVQSLFFAGDVRSPCFTLNHSRVVWGHPGSLHDVTIKSLVNGCRNSPSHMVLTYPPPGWIPTSCCWSGRSTDDPTTSEPCVSISRWCNRCMANSWRNTCPMRLGHIGCRVWTWAKLKIDGFIWCFLGFIRWRHEKKVWWMP